MKQVIVVNGALELPAGKLAAQVAHAAVAGLLAATDRARRRWLEEGMPKVVLRGADAAELERLREAAAAAGIPAELVTDAGRTVVPPGTVTCLALGPEENPAIDRLTGSLPLL
jgi:peptidyl-tRNA hydrolase, PTH2 family